MQVVQLFRNRVQESVLGALVIKDPRWFQIIFLGTFLLYGINALGWDIDIAKYACIGMTCILVQLIGAHATGKSYTSWKSAAITALGLCLLLKANSYATLALAGTIAIGSKFLIRWNGRHFFNPANIGIVVVLLLTGDAWISPGQWGSSVVLLYFFGAAGLMILLKVGRIDTSIAFLLTFAGLEFVRSVLYRGWELDVYLHYLSNGALLLFTFFMITDPVTTPNHPKGRIVWAVIVGLVAFLLTSIFQLHTAPIWALVLLAPLTPLINHIVKGKYFQWLPIATKGNVESVNEKS